MEYPDKIYDFICKMQPGDKYSLVNVKDSQRFIECVKDLIDYWGITDIEFNGTYTQIRKLYPITNIQKDGN